MTRGNPGLGVTGLDFFSFFFSNWWLVHRQHTSSEIFRNCLNWVSKKNLNLPPGYYGPKSQTTVLKVHNSIFEPVTFDDTVMTWSTFERGSQAQIYQQMLRYHFIILQNWKYELDIEKCVQKSNFTLKKDPASISNNSKVTPE